MAPTIEPVTGIMCIKRGRRRICLPPEEALSLYPLDELRLEGGGGGVVVVVVVVELVLRGSNEVNHSLTLGRGLSSPSSSLSSLEHTICNHSKVQNSKLNRVTKCMVTCGRTHCHYRFYTCSSYRKNILFVPMTWC